ncbi:MAG TPA: glycosyltransferase [Thermoanaerobaculia bacterium]|jgi:GT2 family glycosyltransferase|nr:glycosyltransferase [Thermoanaerobaculia bacterium]
MITVAIPTYNRGAIVVETVERLLTLDPPPDAIIVVDQSPALNEPLARLHRQGRIQLIRLDAPSIPRAMNEALLAARTPLVLYLDDDVEPSSGLIAAHERAHVPEDRWAVVGQILQPGEEPRHFEQPEDDLEFHFNHDSGRFVANVMAGNLSVKRDQAIAAGGFDENFVGAGYRFETDFALRLIGEGGRIWFAPEATLRHLRLATGGLRSYGDHRSSPSPAHSAGDYYFAIHHRKPLWRYALRRIRRNVATRYHLGHPWTVPTKLIGELRGLMLARRLARGGRKLIRRPQEMAREPTAFRSSIHS